MKKVFTCGGASWNSVISLDDFPGVHPQTIHNCGFDETLGNTGAGKALNLSQLGFNTTFHTLLGEDTQASLVKKALDHNNLRLIYDTDSNGTERHLNIMNSKGERISIFINPSSDNPSIDYSKFETPIQEADYVIINISNYCRNLIPICKKFQKEIWTDLHDYNLGNSYHQDFIDAADYIFLSSDNLPNWKDFMSSMINNGKKLVVCTHARNGSTALNEQGEWFEVPIIDEFELVNTNGAGDAYFSGFMFAYDLNYDLISCMRFGSLTAGFCIAHPSITNPNIDSDLIQKEFVKYFG